MDALEIIRTVCIGIAIIASVMVAILLYCKYKR